ncbi:MAG TPA: SpoIIE family protein phosphatase [bacterium]|nr:SpoIIE family protein phosphatase [bacterium]HPN29809.1 SpoIIE family protein phosphatase [bacterium]
MFGKSLKIFIIDDESTITTLVKLILSKNGFTDITAFNDPIEAKKKMIEAKPDIVCSDIWMPELTGTDLLKDVKDLLADTIFIMISASSQFDDALTSLKLGAYDYITKPIKKEGLLNVINKASEVITLRKNNKLYLDKLLEQNKLLSDFSKKMNYELQLARELQLKITPKIECEFGDYAIGFNRKFSSEIGGDYIEGYKFRDGDKFAIMIADMPGHGIPAALLLSSFKVFTFQAFQTEKSSGEIMSQVNKNFMTINMNVFPTACCLVIDKKNKTIEYTNAGHPFPFIIGPDSGSRIIDLNETLLGIFEKEYKTNYIDLNKDETLYLYSDGIIEIISKSDGKNLFDLSNLIDFLCEQKRLNKGFDFTNLYNRLIQITGSDDLDDDIMALAITLNK